MTPVERVEPVSPEEAEDMEPCTRVRDRIRLVGTRRCRARDRLDGERAVQMGLLAGETKSLGERLDRVESRLALLEGVLDLISGEIDGLKRGTL